MVLRLDVRARSQSPVPSCLLLLPCRRAPLRRKTPLLYAFGGKGTQDGVVTLASAVAYLGDDLLVADVEDGVIVHYAMTDYGKALENALMADDDKDFDKAVEYWSQVLASNQNLDLAYRALGNDYLRNGYYEKARECFENASDQEGDSKALQYVRTA